jgi:hypothetical protein
LIGCRNISAAIVSKEPAYDGFGTAGASNPVVVGHGDRPLGYFLDIYWGLEARLRINGPRQHGDIGVPARTPKQPLQADCVAALKEHVEHWNRGPVKSARTTLVPR